MGDALHYIRVSHKVSFTRDGNAKRRCELFRGRPRRSGVSVRLSLHSDFGLPDQNPYGECWRFWSGRTKSLVSRTEYVVLAGHILGQRLRKLPA